MIRSVMVPLSSMAPRAFWAFMILSVSSMRVGMKRRADAHHHGKLMHREVQPAQRLEQLLDGIRQHDGLVV